MRKRIAIALLPALAAGIVLIGYFLHRDRKDLLTDPYKAIAADACILIETSDFQSFINSITGEAGLFGELAKVQELNEFNARLKYLSGLMSRPAIKKIMDGGTTLISFHPSGSGKLVPFLSMVIPAEIKLRQVRDVMQAAEIPGVVEMNRGGISLLVIPFVQGNRKDTIFLSTGSGLLTCSSSAAMMKRGSQQGTRDPDIRQSRGFTRVLLASGRNETKVFVIFGNLPELTGSLLGAGRPDLPDKIARLAGSACGDIIINEKGLIISGFAEISDSADLLSRYKTVTSGTLKTFRILPASTALFETIVLPQKDSEKMSDLAVKLKPWMGDEITRAWFNIKGRPVGENTLMIYELTNRVMCEQVFIDMARSGSPLFHFQPDDQTKIPVYQLNGEGIIQGIAGDFAPGVGEKYFTFHDNFMISGSSYVPVSRFLYDNLLNKTLANDPAYREFETTLPSRAGYLFYCVPSGIIDYLALFLNDQIIKGLRANKGSLDKIQAAGFQFASSNDMIYNSLSVLFADEVRADPATEWETLLDTTAGIKPFFFTNHNTGAREIFVQDLKGNAYLINSAGRVLWKVPLQERINGNVFMIDYYRNGKYQLLFSGRNYLHLLDRNGNYVERYPVRLRSPATSPPALFDYDNNRDYRLLIAGEDRLIYSYDKTGSVVKGWKPFKTTGPVTSEISFFRVSGKDYLVAADDRSIYFLDRTGNIRLRPREEVTKAAGSSVRLNPGTGASIVCSAPDGTVQHILFDGQVRKFKPRDFSADHSFDFFDIDADGFGEYIFIDKGMLYLYDNNRTEIFSREFGSPELGGPINFIFSGSDRKIGVFDTGRKLIYLIDRKGNIMSGFPLKGASGFSIGKLSDRSGWHLIVGGTDRFLYNYKLDAQAN
ncbi:MAG: hypothetical protein K0B05_09185 [Bacteroidales bacterium]|nr:hypothetical protein [Bacteroidales bacterium]